jgi:hypothetical protein
LKKKINAKSHPGTTVLKVKTFIVSCVKLSHSHILNHIIFWLENGVNYDHVEIVHLAQLEIENQTFVVSACGFQS